MMPPEPGSNGSRRCGHLLVIAIALTVLTGCVALGDRPGVLVDETRRPVIIVPGMQASRLVSQNTGEVAWGKRLSLALGAGLSRLALPIESLAFDENRDALVPAGIIEGTLARDFFGGLVDGLQRAGYRCVSPTEISPATDCAILAWDWRRDLVEAAARLDRAIERLRAVRGRPDETVNIVAHSAGALVTRYFVCYAAGDVLDRPPGAMPPLTGAGKVRQAFLIAPPNYGSIYGLQRVMRGIRVGLARADPELMATMPSVFQLLPHPQRQWMIDLDGNPVQVDLFDPDTWRTFRVSIFLPQAQARIARRFGNSQDAQRHYARLERFFEHALLRGKRFQLALSVPVRSISTRYVVMGAGCEQTPAVCLLDFEDGRPVIRLYPDEIQNPRPGIDYEALMQAPGDGRVTLASLTGERILQSRQTGSRPFPVSETVLTCANHDVLPSQRAIVEEVLRRLEP